MLVIRSKEMILLVASLFVAYNRLIDHRIKSIRACHVTIRKSFQLILTLISANSKRPTWINPSIKAKPTWPARPPSPRPSSRSRLSKPHQCLKKLRKLLWKAVVSPWQISFLPIQIQTAVPPHLLNLTATPLATLTALAQISKTQMTSKTTTFSSLMDRWMKPSGKPFLRKCSWATKPLAALEYPSFDETWFVRFEQIMWSDLIDAERKWNFDWIRANQELNR